jgi:hypothetical protein
MSPTNRVVAAAHLVREGTRSPHAIAPCHDHAKLAWSNLPILASHLGWSTSIAAAGARARSRSASRLRHSSARTPATLPLQHPLTQLTTSSAVISPRQLTIRPRTPIANPPTAHPRRDVHRKGWPGATETARLPVTRAAPLASRLTTACITSSVASTPTGGDMNQRVPRLGWIRSRQ